MEVVNLNLNATAMPVEALEAMLPASRSHFLQASFRSKVLLNRELHLHRRDNK
jgi:hypothetical protein